MFDYDYSPAEKDAMTRLSKWYSGDIHDSMEALGLWGHLEGISLLGSLAESLLASFAEADDERLVRDLMEVFADPLFEGNGQDHHFGGRQSSQTILGGLQIGLPFPYHE